MGRGDHNNGRGGRGNGDRGGGGRGRGSNYAGITKVPKTGLCSELGPHMFDYGQKTSPDQMKTSWDKLVLYAGTTFGQDIGNEMRNKRAMMISAPAHTPEVLERHDRIVIATMRSREVMQLARLNSKAVLESLVSDNPKDTDSAMKLASMNADIITAECNNKEEIAIALTDMEKLHVNNEHRIYRGRIERLVKSRGQVFSLLLGQCTRVLEDKMMQDPDWEAVLKSSDILGLQKLVEKTILGQTADQYPFCSIYDEELSLYSIAQGSMTNSVWHERFCTKINVGIAMGVTRRHKALLDFVAQEKHSTDYDSLPSS